MTHPIRRHHRSRPRRLDRRLSAEQGKGAGHHPGSRPATTSAASPAPPSTRATTSTSAAIASSPSRRKSKTCGPSCSPTTCSIGRARRASSIAASFFSYPLKAGEALLQARHLRIDALRAVVLEGPPVARSKNPKNFEDWVSNQFGKRLFNIFFKTYTEKVWGMSCKEISADWAAQRIKGLSLRSAVWNALCARKRQRRQDKSKVIKTLIDTFRYPRRGPGMMWEAAPTRFKDMGGDIDMGMKVVGCHYDCRSRPLDRPPIEDAAQNRHGHRSRARDLLRADAAARQRHHADACRSTSSRPPIR